MWCALRITIWSLFFTAPPKPREKMLIGKVGQNPLLARRGSKATAVRHLWHKYSMHRLPSLWISMSTRIFLTLWNNKCSAIQPEQERPFSNVITLAVTDSEFTQALRNCHIACHLRCRVCQLSYRSDRLESEFCSSRRRCNGGILKCEKGFLNFIYQVTRGWESVLWIVGALLNLRFFASCAPCFNCKDALLLFFSLFHYSSLGYLTNAALCVPTEEPSKLAVNNNQQPFHSTENCMHLLFPNSHVQWTDQLHYQPLPLRYLSSICSYHGYEKDWILTSTTAL